MAVRGNRADLHREGFDPVRPRARPRLRSARPRPVAVRVRGRAGGAADDGRRPRQSRALPERSRRAGSIGSAGARRARARRPPAAAASGDGPEHTRVDSIVDKGEGRGALVYASRETRDARTGEPICTTTSTVFCRADGGFGGPSGPVRAVHQVPDREPDHRRVDADPAAGGADLPAERRPQPAPRRPRGGGWGGFERPILHGLCTYGIAGYGVLGALTGWEPRRLKRLDARFSAPVIPGETVTTAIWREGPGRAAFRCAVADRDVTVIDNGYCEFDE